MQTLIQSVIEKLRNPMSPKHFCWCVASFVCVSLFCVSTLNWIVNPYGQYSSNCLQPIVQDSRSEKVELFERLEAAPQGLILGSSRALKFEPEYLQARTSQRFFNFAVNHGRPEDFLAIVRYYRHRFGCFPKTVLIGVDIASLNDVVPNDARLCSEPRLYSFARETSSWSDDFERFSQLFSYQQLASSINSIGNCIRPTKQTECEQKFSPDGVIEYIKRQSEMAAGTYDFKSALDFNEREFLAVFDQFREPSQRRLGYLHETLRLCHANDCQVYLFATVSHPRLRERLITKTKFLEVEEKSLSAMKEMALIFHAKFIDFGSVEKFAGDPDCFVDGIHPLEPNTRRMIDRLLPGTSEASYAIQ